MKAKPRWISAENQGEINRFRASAALFGNRFHNPRILSNCRHERDSAVA
jgi:hypothetical protein